MQWKFGDGTLVETLKPWNLKPVLNTRSSVFSIQCSSSVHCTVANRTKYLNESHLCVVNSLIPGAGSGLAIRPTCPGQHAATIPKGAYLCFFARGQVTPEGPGSNYELGSTRQGTGPQCVFDPRLYDGMNIGRFVNQGGLISGMKALVVASNRCDGYTTFQPNVAETIFDEACNTVYCSGKTWLSKQQKK